ncbi:MAG: hypothetical protein RL662_2396 [Bacteroidota bacterium]|jgi:lysophospholipase L1-like esterase
MKKIASILLLLLLVTSTSIAQEAYDQKFRNYFYDQRRSFFEAMPDTPNEVIMLGNSITNGASWDELFPDLNIKNRGISADITLGVLDRMDEVVSSFPTKVFILIGVNDIARNIPIDTIVYNYTRIVETIKTRSPHTHVYIQSVMPTNDTFDNFKNHQGKTDRILALNQQLEQLAVRTQTHFVDLYTPLLGADGKLDTVYTNDGLHLLGKGYVQWASILKKYIY